MKYITAEQFLGQPESVQKELMCFWIPGESDLIGHFKHSDLFDLLPNIMENHNFDYSSESLRFKKEYCVERQIYIPLFAEGQLREFIEQKTNGLINIETSISGEKKCYRIRVKLNNKPYLATEDVESGSLIEAYWKLACNIAVD